MINVWGWIEISPTSEGKYIPRPVTTTRRCSPRAIFPHCRPKIQFQHVELVKARVRFCMFIVLAKSTRNFHRKSADLSCRNEHLRFQFSAIFLCNHVVFYMEGIWGTRKHPQVTQAIVHRPGALMTPFLRAAFLIFVLTG